VDTLLTVVGKDLLEDVPGIDEDKRRELLRSALAFYEDSLRDQPADTTTRHEAGRAGVHLGDLNRGLRQLPEAAAAYGQAVAWYTALAADFPDQPAYRRELADCLDWQGEVLRLANQPRAAEEAYNQALAVQQALTAEWPHAPGLHRDQARTLYNRGILRMETGRRDEAAADFASAIALLEPLHAAHPLEAVYRQDLARCAINQAILLRGSDRPAEAEDAYGRALALLEQLVAEQPARPIYRLELALALKNRANLRLESTDRADQAAADLDRARPLLERLAADYPRRTLYRLELARCLNSLAGARWFLKQAEAAEATYHEAAASLRQLIREYPEEADVHSELGGVLDNLAILLRGRNGDTGLEEARRYQDEAGPHHLAAALRHYQHLGYRLNLRKHFAGRAETALRLRQPAEAAAAAQAMGQVLPADPAARFRAARVLARCAAAAGGDGHPFADQAVEVLRQALQLGAADLQALKESREFAPLRDRPDFQALVEQLEARLTAPR
jgi:tetratricopeptide (TPR) repeat protein